MLWTAPARRRRLSYTVVMSDDVMRLAMTDCGDFCAVVPFLLGYQPHEQLAVVVLVDKRVRMSACAPLVGWNPEEAAELMAVTDQFDDAQVFMACWSDDVETAEDALALAEMYLKPAQVLDSIVVGPSRWWSRLHEDCCGDTAELATRPSAVQAVVHGLSAAPSREELSASSFAVPPVGPDECEALLQQAATRAAELPDDQWSRTADELHRRGRREELGLEDLALLAVLVDDGFLLRERWLASSRRTAHDDVALWRQVLAICPTDWSPGALAALAHAAWLAGKGTVVSDCLVRLDALVAQWAPHDFLDQVCRQGVDPERWDQMKAGIVLGTPCEAA